MDLLTLRLMALGALGILAGLTLAIALGLAWLVEVRDRRRSRSAAPGPKEASGIAPWKPASRICNSSMSGPDIPLFSTLVPYISR